ncbi:MAG TPA: response regulator transcription factor [Actinomycetota bacterium]|nr:response regulator transcription factor [Actinomycetota bacterium]
MAAIVLLTDRSANQALPALGDAIATARTASHLDLKTLPLSVAYLADAVSIGPEVLLVDAAENPGQGHAILRALRERDPRVPLVAVVERPDLERFPWEETADEILYPSAPEAEIRVRLAMLARRAGTAPGETIRLGPMTLDADSYRVTVAGRALDLTYKEFELLRFLASRPGRVFTRPALLREVWGYQFYGGTRTVDVHIRRLRAKLGPEHESLIETVRGVGYRAADL